MTYVDTNDTQMSGGSEQIACFELLDSMPMGAFILDRDYIVLFWNTRLEEWTGMYKESIVGKAIGKFFPHIMEHRYKLRVDSVFNGAPIIFSSHLHQYIIPVKTPKGGFRRQDVMVTPLQLDEFGCVALFTIQDVTELTNRIEEYKAIKEQHKFLFEFNNNILENSPAGILRLDKDLAIQYQNPAMRKILGIDQSEKEDFTGMKLTDLEPITKCGVASAFENLKKGNMVSLETPFQSLKGNDSYLEIKASPLMGGGRFKGAVFLALDITEKKRAEDALRKAKEKAEHMAEKMRLLSITDGLTGLFNRRYFNKALEKEWWRAMRYGQQVSLLMVDIDYFKRYNDTLGHQAGDVVIQKVAEILKKFPKRPDDLVARYGGEEFVVVLAGTNKANAIKMADRMREGIEALKIKHKASEVCDHLTISLGVATMSPSKALRREELLKAADDALYKAKETGRNRVVAAGQP